LNEKNAVKNFIKHLDATKDDLGSLMMKNTSIFFASHMLFVSLFDVSEKKLIFCQVFYFTEKFCKRTFCCCFVAHEKKSES
jgi:hypothetical protein